MSKTIILHFDVPQNFPSYSFFPLSLESLSQSACVITGESSQAVALANALQKAFGTLHMVRNKSNDSKGNNYDDSDSFIADYIGLFFPNLNNCASHLVVWIPSLSATWVGCWWNLLCVVRSISDEARPQWFFFSVSIPFMQENRWRLYFAEHESYLD